MLILICSSTVTISCVLKDYLSERATRPNSAHAIAGGAGHVENHLNPRLLLRIMEYHPVTVLVMVLPESHLGFLSIVISAMAVSL